MDKVIITGVSGFFGKALALKLLQDNAEVIGVTSGGGSIDCLKKYPNFKVVYADFSMYGQLPQLIDEKHMDVFFHFAWAGGFTTAIRDYALQMQNAAYAADALVAAKKIGCRKFVYSGTYNQYEIINFLRSEQFEPRYTCLYSTGKTAADLLCRTLAYQMGIEYSAGLVPMPYGEGNYSKQLVNVVLEKLLSGVSPQLVEGNNLYDLVYIDDIVDAFIAIAEKGKNQKAYYVGHRQLKTFKEWITAIRDVVAPEVELTFGEYKDSQKIDYTEIDLDALFDDTGFECSANFAETMKSTAEWVERTLM